MIKILELSFNNIGRFIEEQTINFENRNKLIQFDGFNKNTGGSSGAGKSTVIEALMFLLGINTTPATVLQSRLTKKPLYVSGKFLFNNTPVSIERDKKKGLSITFPDKTVSGNTPLAEEQLDQLIGMPRKIFKQIVHKEQKKGGFFLALTAKESYSFLITVLGLESFLKDEEKITNDIKKINEQINNETITITSLQQSLEDLKNILNSKVAPTCNVTLDDLQKYSDQIRMSKENLSLLQKNKQEELKKLTIPTKKEAVVDNTKLLELQKQLSEIKKQKEKYNTNYNHDLNQINSKIEIVKFDINKIENAKIELPKVSSQIKEIKKQEQIIKTSKCPTCAQDWVGSTATDELAKLGDKLKDLISQALQLKPVLDVEDQCRERLISLTKEKELLERSYNIVDFENQLGEVNEQILAERAGAINFDKEMDNQYLKEQNEYYNMVNQIEDKYRISIDEITTKINDITNKSNRDRANYDWYEDNLKKYKKEVSDLNQAINIKTKLLGKTAKSQAELSNKINIAEEGRRLIKSYTLQVFQDTLDSIGEIATSILSNIPNTANATIYFEGCRETQKGTLKDEIHAMLSSDGEQDIPIKSFSGGERTAIDLAVDLAVADVIESKTGRGADFFIFDEPFDGLDNVCREQCLGVLQQLDINKKIIMVDHSDELKQMVEDVVRVVRQGEISTIE